jgi:hypothetical protein
MRKPPIDALMMKTRVFPTRARMGLGGMTRWNRRLSSRANRMSVAQARAAESGTPFAFSPASMPDRRRHNRPDAPERRSFPRPPLWLNLLLLLLATGTFVYARHEREIIRRKTALLFAPSRTSPAELNRIREEMADMDLTKAQLAKQLDAKLAYLRVLQSDDFYLAVDTAKRKLYLRLGKDIVREADVQLGEGRTITAGSRTWTFVPLKGDFNVTGKSTSYNWTVPEWVYAMNNQPVPASRPTIHNGLGNYVVFLPDNYILHSPPPPESPLAGRPKPGSIMVPEADLAAIWPRITNETHVYIF